MTRHIIDTSKLRGGALKRFLRIARRQASDAAHPVLARGPRGRNAAQRVKMFSRIERRGLGHI